MNKYNIVTPSRDCFVLYVMLMRPIFNKIIDSISTNKNSKFLGYKESLVLGNLLYHYNRFSGLNEDDRMSNVFDYDTRMEIKDNLRMSDSAFTNHICTLNKKNIISDGCISKHFIPNVDGGVLRLNLNIKMQDDEFN